MADAVSPRRLDLIVGARSDEEWITFYELADKRRFLTADKKALSPEAARKCCQRLARHGLRLKSRGRVKLVNLRQFDFVCEELEKKRSA